MNVQVKWNGTDITSGVIEYVREHDICTGEGTVDLNVEAKTAKDFTPWDTIVIYENGDKMGTYNIASEEETIPGEMYIVSCQDDSKRLTDTFIDEQYEITYPSTAKYWIELFLTQAGVTYNFNVSGYGAPLSENTTLGFSSVYDILIMLLQMSGWYFYFDADNVCQIGTLTIDTDPVRTYYGDEILKIGYIKSDKMLRNRAVVWGASDKEGNWIFADTSTTTAWNRPNGDYRTVVYQNSAIKTFSAAYYLAQQILNELSQTIPEKTLQVVGSDSDIHLGVNIRGSTDYMEVEGKVTHFTTNMSSDGFTTTYTLDKRCPRMWGYVQWNDWVYIGTKGNGVWRKYLFGDTWYDYSTGITDLNIKDVVAYDGLLGSVSDDGGFYIRHTSQASWYKYSPRELKDYYAASGSQSMITSGISAKASSLDRTYGLIGAVTVGFSVLPSGYVHPSGINKDVRSGFAPSGNTSWVQEVALGGYPVYSQQIVVISGELVKKDFGVVDLETNWDGNNLISVYAGKHLTGTGILTHSGGFTNYEGITSLGGQTLLAYSQDYYNVVDKGIKSFIPPATSGIIMEMNTSYRQASGWYTVELSTHDYDGTVYYDGNIKPNGEFYGFNILEDNEAELWSCKPYLVYNIGTDSWEAVTDSWGISDVLILEADKTIYKHFYKIDGTNFSVLYHDNGVYSLKFIEISNITGSGEIIDEIADTLSFPYFRAYNDGYFEDVMCIENPAGRYYSILNAGAEAEGTALAFQITVIDMKTGGITSTQVFSTDTTYDYTVLEDVVGSPNYIVYTLLECPPLTGTPPITTYQWRAAAGSINKSTGAVSSSETDLFLDTQYTDLTSVALGGESYWSHPHRLRYMFMYPTSEDPTDGSDSYCLGLAWCRLEDKQGFSHYHHLRNVQVLVVTDGTISATAYDDYVTNENPNDPDIQSPVWAKRINENSVYPYYYNTKQIMGTYPGDALMQYYRTLESSDTTYAYAVFIDPTNPAYYTAISFPPTATELGMKYSLGVNAIGFYNGIVNTDNRVVIAGTYNDTNLSNRPLMEYGFDGYVKKAGFIGYDKYGGEDHLGAGQIVGNKSVVYVNNDTNGTKSITIHIIEHIWSGAGILEDNYNILLHTPKVEPSGLFTVIYEGTVPLKVDTAKGIPTVIYREPVYGDYSASFLADSFLNEINSFDTLAPEVPVHDVRTFDLSDPYGFFPASGISASGFLDRYVGVAAGHHGLIMYDSDFRSLPYYPPPHTTICSGNFTHLDFTNNDPDPYIFCCTSGTATIPSGRFLQRNKESLIWNDYSLTLPSGEISVIRADDRM